MQTLFLILNLLSLNLGMQLETKENVNLSNESHLQLNFFNIIQPSLCQKYFEKNLNQIYSFEKKEFGQHLLYTFIEIAKNEKFSAGILEIGKICYKNAKKVKNKQNNHKNIEFKVDKNKLVTNSDASTLPKHIAALSNHHLTSNLSISIRNICILLSMQMFMSTVWSVLIVDYKYLLLYDHCQILLMLVKDQDLIDHVNKYIETILKKLEFSKFYNFDETKYLFIEEKFAESLYFAAILTGYIQILFSYTIKYMRFLIEYHVDDITPILDLNKSFANKSISFLLDYNQYKVIFNNNYTKLDFFKFDTKKDLEIFYNKLDQTKNSELPIILVFDANLGIYFTHLVAEKLIETSVQVKELSSSQYNERLYDISCYLEQIYFINLIIYLLKSFEIISQRSASKPLYRNFFSLIYIYDDDVNNIYNYIHNKYENKFIAHEITEILTVIANHFCYISLIFAEALYEFYQMNEIEYFNLDIISAKKFYDFSKDEYMDYTSYLFHGQKVNKINQQEFNEKILSLQEKICFESQNLIDDSYDVGKDCIEFDKINSQNLGIIENMDKQMSDLVEKRIKFRSELVKYFKNNCALNNDKKDSAHYNKILPSAKRNKNSHNEKIYYSANPDLTIAEAYAFINGKAGNVCDSSKKTKKAKKSTTVPTKRKKQPTHTKKIVHNLPTNDDRLSKKNKIIKTAEHVQTDSKLEHIQKICIENETLVQETKDKKHDVRSDIQDLISNNIVNLEHVHFRYDSAGGKSNIQNKDIPEKNINDLQELDTIKILNVQNSESEPQNRNDAFYEEKEDQYKIQDVNDFQWGEGFHIDTDNFILQISKKKKIKYLNNKTNVYNNANELLEEQKSQINHEYKNGNAQIDTCKKMLDNNKSKTRNQPLYNSKNNVFLTPKPNIFAKNLQKLPIKNFSLENNHKIQPNIANINVPRSTENDVHKQITIDGTNSTSNCIHGDFRQKFNTAKDGNQHDDAKQLNDRNSGKYVKKEKINLDNEDRTTMNGKKNNSNQSLSETSNNVKSSVLKSLSNFNLSDAKVEIGETSEKNMESMNNEFAANEQKKYIVNNSCKFQALPQNTNDAFVHGVSNCNEKIITSKIQGNEKKFIFETHLIEKTSTLENEEYCFIANINNQKEQEILSEDPSDNFNENSLDLTNSEIKNNNTCKVESTNLYCKKCKKLLVLELDINVCKPNDLLEDFETFECLSNNQGLNLKSNNFEDNGHCQYDEKMDNKTNEFLKAKTNIENDIIQTQKYMEKHLDISNEIKVTDTPSISNINKDDNNDKLFYGEEQTINHSQHHHKTISSMPVDDLNDNNNILQDEHIEARKCDQINSIKNNKNENFIQHNESNKNPYTDMLLLHRTSYTPYGNLPYPTNNIYNPLDNYYLIVYVPIELIEGVKRGDFSVEYLSNGNVMFVPTNFD